MKTKRKSISKSIRFEVFKRDSFKCQYCGACAPDVLLHVDHIAPLALGGDAKSITNLITACEGCNLGKGSRSISDDSVSKKRKGQLDQLQLRREQLEMMSDWQRGLLDLDELATEECARLWSCSVPGFSLNENGKAGIRKLIKQFSMGEVMYAIRRASAHYLKRLPDGRICPESVEVAFGKIGGICVLERRGREHPELVELYKIRSMLSFQIGFTGWRYHACLNHLSSLFHCGYSPDTIRRIVAGIDRWSQFENAVARAIEEDSRG